MRAWNSFKTFQFRSEMVTPLAVVGNRRFGLSRLSVFIMAGRIQKQRSTSMPIFQDLTVSQTRWFPFITLYCYYISVNIVHATFLFKWTVRANNGNKVIGFGNPDIKDIHKIAPGKKYHQREGVYYSSKSSVFTILLFMDHNTCGKLWLLEIVKYRYKYCVEIHVQPPNFVDIMFNYNQSSISKIV